MMHTEIAGYNYIEREEKNLFQVALWVVKCKEFKHYVVLTIFRSLDAVFEGGGIKPCKSIS